MAGEELGVSSAAILAGGVAACAGPMGEAELARVLHVVAVPSFDFSQD